MTLAAGSTSDDAGHKDAAAADTSQRALEPARPGSAADPLLAPFFAAAEEVGLEQPTAPRSFYTKVIDYSAHAAMIAGLLGFAWTVSNHVGKHPASSAVKPAAPAAVSFASLDETAELRRVNQKMAADLTALRGSLEALRGTLHPERTAEQLRQLSAGLDGVKGGLVAAKTEAKDTAAQLAGKIDHLPHPDAGKLQQLAERVERLEHQELDKTATGSIPPAAAKTPLAAAAIAAPPVKPVAKDPAEPAKKAGLDKPAVAPEPDKKPVAITDWVVRDVYDGVAVVESKHGPLEVVPGVAIPGAGVVKSIDRHGAGWTVTTTKGVIAFVPLPRGRNQHGYYRTVPEDF